MGKSIFGPGILGQEVYDRQVEDTKAGRGIFGPGITGYDPEAEAKKKAEPEPTVVPAPVQVDIPQMSVEKIKDLLIGSPEFLDGAIEIEFQREPAPRRGALRFFIEVEKENENRVEVLKRLEDALP